MQNNPRKRKSKRSGIQEEESKNKKKCQTRRIEEEEFRKKNPRSRIQQEEENTKKWMKLSRPRQCSILRSAYENIEDLRRLAVTQYTETCGKHQI